MRMIIGIGTPMSHKCTLRPMMYLHANGEFVLVIAVTTD